MRKLLIAAILAGSTGLVLMPGGAAYAKGHVWGGHAGHAAASSHAAAHAEHAARAEHAGHAARFAHWGGARAYPHWGGGFRDRDFGRRDWDWRADRRHHHFPWPYVVFGVLSNLLPPR